MIGELHRQGFRWEEYLSSISPDNSPHGDLKRLRKGVLQLADTFEAQKKRLNFQRLIVKWESLETDFLRLAMEHYDSDIAQNLVSAFRHSDPDSYRAAYEKLTMHHNRAVGLKLRKALLEKLTAAAPDWADAIRHRIGPHASPEPPGSPSSAWEWRQLNDELERRSRTSLIEIQSRLEELRSRLREITIELVEKKAWAAQLRRTSLRQQQALCGWKEIMHRLSRAAAGRNQMLGAEARRLAPICQSAIPVWIMPLNQIAENFDPGSNRFDVVIIDEASQADVMALIPLYMGEKAVIVGDHEQVSPIAVGQSLEQVRNLISQYLEGIPNSVSYDGQMSIYNLAQASFSGTISLREHFRCVPQIINYSNWLSYDWKIVPLRDFSQVKRRPPTVAYRVEGASPDTGGVNVEEARHLVSLIAACIEQPEYGDSTFGIISMLGDDQRGQAGYINRLLAEVLPATEIERRQISCGNAYYFQGDERDVIFLSLVAAAGLGTQLRFLSPEAANERYKKRFNVAASRARDQIWVVHSLDPLNDLQPGDLRRDLILHAMNPDAYQHPAQTQVAPFETEFERLVRRDLIRSGFRVIPKWRIGSYRMDMVVEGDGRRVAIECDGDKPYPFTAMEHDLTRQQILERLGWQFIRIRGSQYFRDPERTIKAVIDALESIMLTADGNSRPHQQPGPDGLELKERVIARAVEIRKTILVRSEELRLRLA